MKKHSSVVVSIIFLIVALVIIYPYYQYYIDPDATAYLTIAKRYAAGDYEKAINGYWSPWSIWFTAILMKTGMPIFLAAIIINSLGATGFLCVSHSIFLFFKIDSRILWLLNFVLAIFLVYAVFWQTFDDIWECFFLLAILRIMISKHFATNVLLWILSGLIGALAFLAKAYAFPFFVLEILVCTYLLVSGMPYRKYFQWLKMSGIIISSMLVFATPWIYLLYNKYGIWMTGTAGKLNTSWYLIGHPYWKEGINYLLPPVYNDSPSYWEDPFFVNGRTPHFWNSSKLMALQAVRLGYNSLKFALSINELSCFFGVSIIAALMVMLTKKLRNHFEQPFILVIVSFLLFPLGYLLVNFQSRYLWYMLPLSMVITVVVAGESNLLGFFNRKFRLFLFLVFAASFLVQPILGLKEMFREGYREHQLAALLKKERIKGSFTTNIPYSDETKRILRLAYFSENPYYYLPIGIDKKSLLSEMKRYKVKYYFHFYEGDWDNFYLSDENGHLFPEVADGKIRGVKIFLIQG